jgi:hypothetical protein
MNKLSEEDEAGWTVLMKWFQSGTPISGYSTPISETVLDMRAAFIRELRRDFIRIEDADGISASLELNGVTFKGVVTIEDIQESGLTAGPYPESLTLETDWNEWFLMGPKIILA